jgi:predicted lactoylglutathione lyase
LAAKRTASRRPVKKKAARKAAKSRRPKRHQPESLRLRSAAPGLTVNDLQKSLAFYRDALGFIAGEEWRENGELRGIELKAGAVAMWLTQDDWKQGRDRKKGIGCRTFFITAQDVDRIAARVKAAGGNLLHEPETRYGFRDIGVEDPDGFRMTIQMPVKKGR